MVGFWTRAADRRSDRGASFFEYAALLAVVAGIITSMFLAEIPQTVLSRTATTICKAFGGSDCGDQGSGTQAGNDEDPGGDGDGDGADGGSDWGSLNWLKGPASTAWQIGDAFVDDITGLIDLVKDPSTIIDAGKYIFTDPLGAAKQLVWDDETQKLFDKGDFWGVGGRLGWNIGSWFIPYYDIGKAVGKISKLGKMGKLGKVAKLAKEAAEAAERARKAAKAGDADGARKAAEEAQRKADEAKEEARKQGCKAFGLAPSRRHGSVPSGAFTVRTRTLVSGVLALLEGADDEPCKKAKDAQKEADDAKRKADEAAEKGRKKVEERRKAQDAARAGLKKLGLSPQEIEQIIQGAGKNTLVLDRFNTLLRRSDLDQAKLAKFAKDLAKAREGVDPADWAGLMAKMNEAGGIADVRKANLKLAENGAEVSTVARIIREGRNAPGAKIYAGKRWKNGKPAIELDFGAGRKVRFDDIHEIDTAYIDRAGKVHLVEVKNTMRALLEKTQKSDQLERMQAWAGKGTGRQSEIHIESAADKQFAFYKVDGRTSLIQKLANSGMSVRLGDKVYTPSELRKVAAQGSWD